MPGGEQVARALPGVAGAQRALHAQAFAGRRRAGGGPSSPGEERGRPLTGGRLVESTGETTASALRGALQDLAEQLLLVADGEEAAAEFRRNFAAQVTLGRIARPEEIAAAVLFLASDHSSFVTGSSLYVDGGLNQI